MTTFHVVEQIVFKLKNFQSWIEFFEFINIKIFDSNVDRSFIVVDCNSFLSMNCDDDDERSKFCKYLFANVEKICERLIDNHHYFLNNRKSIEICIRFSRRDEWLIFFIRKMHVANDKKFSRIRRRFWNESFFEKFNENNRIIQKSSKISISKRWRIERSISIDSQSTNDFDFFRKNFDDLQLVCLSVSIKIIIWLILSIIICLSQRLNHACLNINNYIVKLRMIYMNYSIFSTNFYLQHCSRVKIVERHVRQIRNRKNSIQRLKNNWSIDFDWNIIFCSMKFEQQRH